MQCKAQLCILKTSDFKLAPPLSDNPQGMQHVVSDFDLNLFVSNTKQRFCLRLPVTHVWESTTLLHCCIAHCFAWSAIRPLYGLSELAGCMNRKSVMEVILLPHVAMVVSKQHQDVTETRIFARGRGRRDIGFAQGWPQPKCVLVTVAVLNAAVTSGDHDRLLRSSTPPKILLCEI